VPNVLTITVENPDQIRNAGAYDTTAIMRLQTSATEAGAFADVSGTGSTPTIPVVAATNSYNGYDPNGIGSSWYRTRFENAGATRLSDWSAAFQTGDETVGLLCSVADVSQRMFGTSTTTANQTEMILDIIRGVSADIEGYVGRWLAPRPTNPASTMTLLFDNDGYSRSLLLEQGHVIAGVRSVTVVGVATSSQPETGGTFTSATLADVLIRPRPTADGPGLRLVLSDVAGSINRFYPGYNTVSVTGSFGFASVPADIQEVAIAAVTKRFLGKETAAAIVSLGPEGGVTILSDLSPANRATLLRYAWPRAA
jgi:hypothetical protein